MSKRLKSSDAAVMELQRRAEDATGQLQSSQSEIQRLTADLLRARASNDETQSRLDAANRDNKQLAGSTGICFFFIFNFLSSTDAFSFPLFFVRQLLSMI